MLGCVMTQAVRSEIIRHGGLIYLIGEDEAVRDSLAALLQAHGYGVIAQARHDRPPALALDGALCVILDPQQEGRREAEVVAETRRAFPQLPMIAICHGLEPKPRPAWVTCVLRKPLSPGALLDAIRDLAPAPVRAARE